MLSLMSMHQEYSEEVCKRICRLGRERSNRDPRYLRAPPSSNAPAQHAANGNMHPLTLCLPVGRPSRESLALRRGHHLQVRPS
jgi:hypothetical protein